MQRVAGTLCAAVAVLAAFGAAPAFAIDAHFWHADGHALDDVGAADGTLVGSVGFAAGARELGFDLSGDDRVTLPVAELGDEDFELRLDLRTTATGDRVIASRRPACDGGVRLELRIAGGQVVAYVQGTSGALKTLNPHRRVDDGAFHRIRLRRQAGQVQLDIDGGRSQAASGLSGPLNLTTGRPLALGWSPCADTDPALEPLAGVVDEVYLGPPQDDEQPPTTTATVTPPAGPSGWHTEPPAVRISTNDGTGFGVQWLEHSLGGALSRSPGGVPVEGTVTTDGESVVAFRAQDHGGNLEPQRQVTVRLDRTPPAIVAGLADGAIVTRGQRLALTYTCTDAASGVAACSARDGGSAVASGAALDTSRPGERTITLSATDAAGHSATLTRRLTVVDVPAGAPAGPVVITTVPTGPSAARVIPLRSARRCLSRRRLGLRLRPPAGLTVRRVEIRLTRRKRIVLRGRRAVAPISLRNLPPGRVTVRVIATLSDGTKLTRTRTYRTCRPKPRRR